MIPTLAQQVMACFTEKVPKFSATKEREIRVNEVYDWIAKRESSVTSEIVSREMKLPIDTVRTYLRQLKKEKRVDVLRRGNASWYGVARL